MKLTVLLLLAATFQVSAGTYSQGVTLKVKNIPLEKVFTEIEKQSGFSFVYGKSDLVKTIPITIDEKNANLKDVLDKCFFNQPLTYTIKDKFIVVKEKSEKKLDPVTEGLNPRLDPAPPPATKDINGKITDENGAPLTGASIKVKGSQQGTTTNAEGVFILKGVDENATIEISFVGYETVSLKVGGRTSFVLSLKVKEESLQEVVVNKGYYTEKQKYSVSNVTKVTSKDIEKQPVTNPLLALQGLVPGLYITPANGLPGSVVNVRIQGQNSIGRGKDPFYIIDGVPYSSQLLGTTGFGAFGNAGSTNGIANGSGNPLSFINSSDIESIEVLKDADATAIYGSRAANGAILITTKKGKAGSTRASINVQNGWGRVTRFMKLMNTQQYLEMRREAKKNDNLPITATDYDINGFWDTTRYTDWQKELFGQIAEYSNFNTNISGGNNYVQYLISGTYQRQTTVTPGRLSDQKGTLHFNINSLSANQKFRAQLTGSYLVGKNTLAGIDLTSIALQMSPTAPKLYNLDGTLNWAPNVAGSSTWANPLSYLARPYENDSKNLILNSIFSYRLLKNLDFKTSLGYNQLQIDEYKGTPVELLAPETRVGATRSANYSFSTISTWIIEPQLTYQKKISSGIIDILLGTTFQNINKNGYSFTGRGYSSDAVMKDLRSASTVTVGNSIASKYRYNALFGRVNFNWQGKYLLNLTARRDGSSRFGPENLFHNFWGVGAGWIFTEERFVQKGLPFLNFAKIRANYGTTGNDQIGDYAFMNLYTIVSAGIQYQSVPAYAPTGHSNPFLQWEETRKINVGLDLSFFNNRVSLSIEFARNRSSNQLASYSLPIATGYPSVVRNFPATVQNKEWEYSVATINVKTKSFTWNSRFNLTIPRNKLVSFPNLSTSGLANVVIIGQPIGIYPVYKYLGVNPNTGVYDIADRNGNATLNPTENDKTVLINFLPKFYGGLENTFAYKAFHLDILLQYVNKISADYNHGFPYPGIRGINQPISVLNRWKKPGDISNVEKFSSDFIGSDNYDYMTSSDAGYSDASFLRFKNIALSYLFENTLLKKARVQDVRLFINAQNLFTITKYKGLDPETGSDALPPLRIVTVGAKITF